jgi:hypothetical protein
LPPGRQPYDPLNGLRVGALAGGLVGAGVTAAAGAEYIWFIAIFAVVGGGVGMWSQRLTRGSSDER